jgi:hypothetical protein
VRVKDISYGQKTVTKVRDLGQMRQEAHLLLEATPGQSENEHTLDSTVTEWSCFLRIIVWMTETPSTSVRRGGRERLNQISARLLLASWSLEPQQRCIL